VVDVAGFIGVEDILGGLDARAGTVPEFGVGVFGTDVEVECVFNVGGAFCCAIARYGQRTA
jgi:hypothetical protein